LRWKSAVHVATGLRRDPGVHPPRPLDFDHLPPFLEPIRFALEGDDLGVVHQAIDQRDDAGGVWKDFVPFSKRTVGGDQRAFILIATRDSWNNMSA
jgi:hypothetical protein